MPSLQLAKFPSNKWTEKYSICSNVLSLPKASRMRFPNPPSSGSDYTTPVATCPQRQHVQEIKWDAKEQNSLCSNGPTVNSAVLRVRWHKGFFFLWCGCESNTALTRFKFWSSCLDLTSSEFLSFSFHILLYSCRWKAACAHSSLIYCLGLIWSFEIVWGKRRNQAVVLGAMLDFWICEKSGGDGVPGAILDYNRKPASCHR